MSLPTNERPRIPFALEAGEKREIGPGIFLAPLRSEDAEHLGASFAAIDPWMSYPYPAAALAKYFAQQEASAPRLALYADAALAGVLGLRLAWLRGPYVQFLGLLPSFQGRGLGTLALAWIEGEAHRAGERNLWVAASDFNAGARRFYERHGFVSAATLDGLVRDGRTEFLLRKRLA